MILLYIFGAKRALIAVPIVVLLVFGSLQLVRWLRVESLELAALRARTITGSVGGGSNYFVRLDPLRYGAIINSMNTSTKRLSFLWGNGYGSYYTEEAFPFPLDLVDAWPEYSAMTGQYYYLHNFPFQVLFKHGIIGMVIILILWMGPAWECFKTAFNRRDPSLFMGVMGCLLAFVPSSMLNLYWSGKGTLMSGFIIAVLLSIVEQYRQDEGDMLLPNEVYEGSYNWTQQ
jgi:O-antigen ligase